MALPICSRTYVVPATSLGPFCAGARALARHYGLTLDLGSEFVQMLQRTSRVSLRVDGGTEADREAFFERANCHGFDELC